MNFSEKIKLICKKEEINLKKFSELTKIPYSSLKKYNQGLMEPKTDKVHQIIEIPRFSKYKNMLLGIDDNLPPTDEEMERFNRLYYEAVEQGREDELLKHMEFLLSLQDKR